jgi:hypothetical protein
VSEKMKKKKKKPAVDADISNDAGNKSRFTWQPGDIQFDDDDDDSKDSKDNSNADNADVNGTDNDEDE